MPPSPCAPSSLPSSSSESSDESPGGGGTIWAEGNQPPHSRPDTSNQCRVVHSRAVRRSGSHAYSTQWGASCGQRAVGSVVGWRRALNSAAMSHLDPGAAADTYLRTPNSTGPKHRQTSHAPPNCAGMGLCRDGGRPARAGGDGGGAGRDSHARRANVQSGWGWEGPYGAHLTKRMIPSSLCTRESVLRHAVTCGETGKKPTYQMTGTAPFNHMPINHICQLRHVVDSLRTDSRSFSVSLARYTSAAPVPSCSSSAAR